MTTKSLPFALVLVLAATPFAHARHHGDDDDWSMPLKSEETIERTFAVTSSGEATLDLDNVYGSIEVVGTSGHEIRVTIAKTVRAADQASLERSKTEVTLDEKQDGNAVRLYVDGPFRCHSDCGNCFNLERDRRYVVKMDFTVRVPERTALRLATVNEGRVTVQNVIGDYKVHNVNGEITMKDVGGSGVAKTVNGAVKVSFRENPREDSQFGTVNGDVELVFASRLAADFRFKTMNGEIYSDYTMTALPPAAPTAERKDGRFVYHSDRFTGGRVGSGGPEIKLENLNGDLRVLERAS